MQCVFLILYILYGILYMYIMKYGCVFLKLGESIYVAMDLIPILLGSLPLAHNAQHSLVVQLGRAVCMYMYVYTCIYMYLFMFNCLPGLRYGPHEDHSALTRRV